MSEEKNEKKSAAFKKALQIMIARLRNNPERLQRFLQTCEKI